MIICEPVCNFNQHVPINATMIKALVEYEKKQMLMLCSNDHWCELKKNLPLAIQALITHHHIDVLRRSDDWRGWKDSFQLIQLIKKLASKGNERLVFLSTTTGILGLSKWCLFRFKTICVVHLVLARIEGYVPRNPLKAWFSLRKTLLRFNNENCKIVVLEQHILVNLLNVMPHLKAFVECILHPLPEDHSNTILSSSVDFSLGKTLCFPGTFNKEKGAELFCELAELKSEQLKFVVAGKLATDFKMKNTEHLFTLPPAKAPLTRADFSNIINSSHFIFLGHEPSVYKWVASGVYLDALSYEKPIIAKKSQFFEGEFRKYGEFGFLFEHIDELEVFFSSKLNKESYALYRNNINNAKRGRSAEFNTSIRNILS